MHAPAVLEEEGERVVVEWLVGVADPLDEDLGQTEPVGLGCDDAGDRYAAHGRRQADLRGRQAAEVENAAEVEFEDLLLSGPELNDVDVGAALRL